MKTVELTARQRLNVEGMISSKAGTLSFEEQILWAEIRKKVKVSVEDRELLINDRVIPPVVDEEAIDAYPVSTVDLENEEVRGLLKMVKEWAKYSDGDTVWSVPLKEALEAK
jgi:hypothetical protein